MNSFLYGVIAVFLFLVAVGVIKAVNSVENTMENYSHGR